jgi:hypothetical protein
MTTIKLLNEDGVIKGVDTESGEEVPVEFDDLAASSVRTDDLSIKIPSGSTLSEIQTIINDNPGAYFRFPQETLTTNDYPLEITVDGVTLDGQGPFGGFALRGESDDTVGNFIEVDASNVTIRNMEVDGNGEDRPNVGGQDSACGIFIKASSPRDAVRIVDNYVHDTLYSHIRAKAGTQIRNLVYHGNYCETTHYGGSLTSDNLSTTGDVLNAQITNNVNLDCQTDAIEISGISGNALVQNNICIDCGRRNIFAHGNGNTTIIGNYCEGADELGILGAPVAIGNIVRDSVAAGIDGAVIIGNHVRDCDSVGIRSNGGESFVFCNTVSECEAGIAMFQPNDGGVVIGNEVTDNNGRGIFADSANSTIRFNKVRGNDVGILLKQSDADVFRNLVFDSDSTNYKNNGVRPRYNGVIGGGVWGGVDLSETEGQFDGDLAVADGTSTAAAGAWARWVEGESNWQYVDPTGTV